MLISKVKILLLYDKQFGHKVILLHLNVLFTFKIVLHVVGLSW